GAPLEIARDAGPPLSGRSGMSSPAFQELHMSRKRFSGTVVAISATLLAIGCSSGSDQSDGDFQGDQVNAARIVSMVHHDESRPLREMVLTAKAAQEPEDDPDRVVAGKESPDKATFQLPRHSRPLISQGPDPAVHTDIRDLTMPAPVLNFDGVGNGF